MSNKVAAKLGQSAEDYLEAILAVEASGRPVRVKDLAGRLGVSRPSVVSALAALAGKGMVVHERYGGVELTAAGRRAAGEVSRRHRLVSSFLREVLGVSERVADADACRIEHALSAETVNRLVDLMARRRRRAGSGR
jgi:DtxR family Mn-dependent transcriptional regulator